MDTMTQAPGIEIHGRKIPGACINVLFFDRHHLIAAEQIFDRRSAAENYRIFAVRHGLVNFDASDCQTTCDGPLVDFPCYTAIGSHTMPQRSQSRWDPHLTTAASGQARPCRRAPVSGSSGQCLPREAPGVSHRAIVRLLGEAVYSIPQQAASAGDGAG